MNEPKKINLHTSIVVGILAIILGFFTGTTYTKIATPKPTTSSTPTFGQPGTNGRRFNGAGNGGNGINGEIINQDNVSLTIKLRDGGSKIVFFSSSTAIMKMTRGTQDELRTGMTVSAMGSNNPDGSLTAQTIQLRPNFPTSTTRTQ